MNSPQPAEQPEFIRRQYQFAAHIRNPQANPRPADVEQRRMAIYNELFYNNVSGFIADNFPVIRQIITEERWHAMVRDFFHRHNSKTPYFLEIAQEFIHYLEHERTIQDDPPFLLELAHYEWVELALDISEADKDMPVADPNGDLLTSVPLLSPLAWNLSYRFPVHRIGPDYLPQEPGEQPTHLVVYRNRQEEVEFLEINAVTQRLIQLMKENPEWTGLEVISAVAEELQHPQPETVMQAGLQLLLDLRQKDIIIGTRP